MVARVSIIIPCLNEGAVIESLLTSLQPMRECGHEVIVVDGGSRDDTVERAAPWVDQLLRSPAGRAGQMTVGADAAEGDIFWFLHADTALPDSADRLILEGMETTRKGWGRFDVTLSGKHPMLRVVEWMMNLRSRLSGIATGDQGIFVSRPLFLQSGGFPNIPLMEDIALSKKLKQTGLPLCLKHRLTTSSRRWEQGGILRTIGLMWRLRLAYALGSDPKVLAARYRQCSSPTQNS
ncbi:MAG: TIGR04283 family arsenosugar biosynthesis glycosyltransferase [Chromatiales bacterium]|nr:TIGR04283 family arsenosugar biosynthesis glycosyltransferase [Chromatiales bacterium]